MQAVTAGAALLMPFPAQAGADDDTTVALRDGRRFSAQVDRRSDAERLWLRFESADMTILRPIAWRAIADVTNVGVVWKVDDFRTALLAGKIATAADPHAGAGELVTRTAKTPTTPRRGGLETWRVPSPLGSAEFGNVFVAPPIATLQIDAFVAQWDADVEADGLVVTLTPIGTDGRATPVEATAEIELIGPATPPLSRGNAFPVLGRWTRALHVADVGDDGSYRLPLEFQAFHPDDAHMFWRHALVHVRLSVPGRGTFEASIDGVALQGYTPTRDYVQQAFGTRFLPNERTGRGHRESSRGAP